MTPVANSFVVPVCAENGGGLRWIGQRGASAGSGGAAVADAAEHVHEPPERRFADRDRHRAAGAARGVAAPQAVGRLERDGAGGVRVDMGLDFGDHDPPVGIEDLDRVLDRRQGAFERQVDDGAADGDDLPLDPLIRHETRSWGARGISHGADRAAKRHRVAERRAIRRGFVDISPISTMCKTPRAKEGSGAASATRFAPTHGEYQIHATAPRSVARPTKPSHPRRERQTFAQCEKK